MKYRLVSMVMLGALWATACAPQATAPAPASPAPTTAAPAASATPAPSPTAAPTAAPAGFSWGEGQALKPYDFKGVGGVYFDRARSLIYVVDATQADATSPRYLIRKFQPDGTFVSEVTAALEGEEAPHEIDAMTFDPAGHPIFTYEDKDDAWKVLKLFTATVVRGDKLPFSNSPRAGVSALGASGAEIRIAVLGFEKDSTGDTGGLVQIGAGEEDAAPRVISSIPDPLYPTKHMAFALDGSLFLAGPRQGGGQGLKRIQADGKLSDLDVSLGQTPEGMWVGPAGMVYLTESRPGQPLTVRRYSAEGTASGETTLKIAGGGYLDTVQGLTFDAQGRPIVAGKGYDAAGKRVTGLYRFEE